MKKILCVLLLIICMSSLLTGCYTCDICGESKLIFDKNDEKVYGQEYSYCGDCKEDLEELSNALSGW